MDKYAVFGNPISQSKSPLIHSLFAQQFGESISYEAILLPTDQFGEQVAKLFEDRDFKGANVTVPFKQNAADFALALSEDARVAGAVNTLIKLKNGVIVGANTDGKGLVGDLQLNDVVLEGSRVLIVGAGGAARGVLKPLLDSGVDNLTVVNRTPEKASNLAAHFSDKRISAEDFSNIDGVEPFDLIINSTSASLYGELPPLSDSLISEANCCYDMAYLDKPTVFIDHCRKRGVDNCIDGLGMLVGQAAESYYLWRGVRPDPAPVLSELRHQLSLEASSR